MFSFGFRHSLTSLHTQYISCSVGAYELLICAMWLVVFSVFFSPGDKMLWCECEQESGNNSERRKTGRETGKEEEGERTQYLKIYTFLNTDTRLCSSRPCAGNATCIETGQGYMCVCPQGYTGENCHLKPGPCFSNR